MFSVTVVPCANSRYHPTGLLRSSIITSCINTLSESFPIQCVVYHYRNDSDVLHLFTPIVKYYLNSILSTLSVGIQFTQVDYKKQQHLTKFYMEANCNF